MAGAIQLSHDRRPQRESPELTKLAPVKVFRIFAALREILVIARKVAKPRRSALKRVTSFRAVAMGRNFDSPITFRPVMLLTGMPLLQ
jgi:hypothetical protein